MSKTMIISIWKLPNQRPITCYAAVVIIGSGNVLFDAKP